jgi:hypothetical protein
MRLASGLREMIEERDRIIRKLSKKVDKLESTIKKIGLVRATGENANFANSE